MIKVFRDKASAKYYRDKEEFLEGHFRERQLMDGLDSSPSDSDDLEDLHHGARVDDHFGESGKSGTRNFKRSVILSCNFKRTHSESESRFSCQLTVFSHSEFKIINKIKQQIIISSKNNA
jgi:hypothetical protein